MDNFEIKIARTQEEIKAVQQLRFEVFALERKKKQRSSQEGDTDFDKYDPFCDQLIIIDKDKDIVVGIYRMLLSSKVEKNIGFYSEQVFDLTNIRRLKGEMLELGRSCIKKNYRNRNVLNLLWQGIAQYILEHKVRYLFGCSSIFSAVPKEISEIFYFLKKGFYSKEEFRVYPLDQYKFNGLIENNFEISKDVFRKLPILIQGYLKTGAKVCGYPAISPKFFDTVVLFILLDTSRMAASYRQRFFKNRLHI
ncbi:MAG: GNAT family N-acetyltransferase [Candidatus Omnitrophica bacterium]|nr:GNAT family N-acetyltransferase [Candidatus Omnitrophota bacterium]